MTGQQTARRRPNHSTGPKTPEGKRRCRLNAFRHGLTGQLCVFTPDEQQAYEKHCKVVLDALAPVGDFERDIAQSIADDRWRLKRARALEAGTFALGMSQHSIDNSGLLSADIARIYRDLIWDYIGREGVGLKKQCEFPAAKPAPPAARA